MRRREFVFKREGDSGILFADWRIQADGEVIARQYDNLSRSIVIVGDIPDGYTWDLLVQAASDLWDTEDNNPDNAPTLWEDIAYKEGYRIIPEVITSTAAFAMGEYGWWKDVLYKSLMDANVWTPDQNPDVWDEV